MVKETRKRWGMSSEHQRGAVVYMRGRWAREVTSRTTSMGYQCIVVKTFSMGWGFRVVRGSRRISM